MAKPILIADISEPVRELLKKTLADAHPLIIAESPAHALKVMTTTQKPSLAFICVSGSMNKKGKNVFTDMRALAPGMTIIALAERDEEDEAVEAVRTGATGYMIKPLNPAEVLSIIPLPVLNRGNKN